MKNEIKSVKAGSLVVTADPRDGVVIRFMPDCDPVMVLDSPAPDLRHQKVKIIVPRQLAS